MTRPFKEVYSFYISLVVQFIDFWEMFRKNKLPFSALYKFSKRIKTEMNESSADWKRVLNYYKVYAMTTSDEYAEAEEIDSKLLSIFNTTILMHYDLVMFNSLREICSIIIDKGDKESREDLYQHINYVIEYFLKDRMSKRYYAEDNEGDPDPDPYGIKDAAYDVKCVRRNASFPNIEENDHTSSHRLVSEGKCDYIGRARYCAYFMSSIVLDDRELLSNPNWKPIV